MSITKTIKQIVNFIYHLYAQCCAHYRKQRSIRALERLDDYLLDDIGLVRDQDKIVPLKGSVRHLNTVRDQRSKTRLRHAYLVRRRRYLKNRGASG